MVRTLFTDPGAFMESRAQSPNIRWEVVVVLLVGGLGSPGLVSMALRISEVSGSESIVFPLLGTVLTPVFGAVFLWFFYALSVHLVSIVYGGGGPVRGLLKTTPWALIPIGIGNGLWTISQYWVFQEVVDIEEVLSDPDNLSNIVSSVLEAGAGETVGIVGELLLIVSVLGTGYLLYYAVRSTKDISPREARIVVGVPLGVHVVLLLQGVLQAAGVL